MKQMLCVHRSSEGATCPSAQPYNPPGCGYPRALAPHKDRRQLVADSFIYRTRPLMCTQIGVWDAVRALKQCQQPSHNPAEKRCEACVTAMTLAWPYLLFPSPKGHTREGGRPAAQASEELPTAQGMRRRVGRANTREAQQQPRGFEAPLLPAPSGAAPGAGPVRGRQAIG